MRKLPLLVFVLVALLFLMGDVNLQQSGGTPVDIGSSVTTVGQYAVLAWLIVRSDKRFSEQQEAWRNERRWMVEAILKGRGKLDEN